MNPTDVVKYKVLIIGDGNVGKTSLLLRSVDDIFSDGTTPTIGVDFRVKTYIRDNIRRDLHIWDTAGQERFRNVVSAYYRNAHCAFLVFDLYTPSTFHSLGEWIKHIEESGAKPIMVLVGNKSDLPHKVMSADIQKFATDHNISSYVETSAKNGIGVDRMFEILIEKLVANDHQHDTQVENHIRLRPDASIHHTGKTCC